MTAHICVFLQPIATLCPLRMFDRFDILRADGGIVWIESASGLQRAKERIKLFAANQPGEYMCRYIEREPSKPRHL